MVRQSLPTTHEYQNRMASFDRQLHSLERRRDEVCAQLENCQSPKTLMLALFAPRYRRGMILTVHALRQELARVERSRQDLAEELEATRHEQQQCAADLEENTRLHEQELSLSRDFRWLAVQEDRRKLQQRKSVLEQALTQDRLRDEDHTLRQQQLDLQRQLRVVRDRLEENRQQRDSFKKVDQSQRQTPVVAPEGVNGAPSSETILTIL